MRAIHVLLLIAVLFAGWTLYHNYSKHPGTSLV